jgi:hypothetical protein
MSENSFETRAGFKVYDVALESGEVLKYPALNADDAKNVGAGFYNKFKKLSAEFTKARTDGDRADVLNDMHWLMFEKVLTDFEIEDWENLTLEQFAKATQLGGEAAGLTQKK